MLNRPGTFAERCAAAADWPRMQRLALAPALAITGLVLIALASMIWLSGPASPPGAIGPSGGAPPSRLAIPVAGIRPEQLTDTYTQSRTGGRTHDATDIMAPAGTPVVAAAGGTVEKLYFSRGGGGITAYVRSPDRRWMFYYAHLRGYAPGLHEGQALARGGPIGFVGSTGNASPDAPHLHFAILRMAPGDGWWQGTPINPYPLLAGNGAPR